MPCVIMQGILDSIKMNVDKCLDLSHQTLPPATAAYDNDADVEKYDDDRNPDVDDIAASPCLQRQTCSLPTTVTDLYATMAPGTETPSPRISLPQPELLLKHDFPKRATFPCHLPSPRPLVLPLPALSVALCTLHDSSLLSTPCTAPAHTTPCPLPPAQPVTPSPRISLPEPEPLLKHKFPAAAPKETSHQMPLRSISDYQLGDREV